MPLTNNMQICTIVPYIKAYAKAELYLVGLDHNIARKMITLNMQIVETLMHNLICSISISMTLVL